MRRVKPYQDAVMDELSGCRSFDIDDAWHGGYADGRAWCARPYTTIGIIQERMWHLSSDIYAGRGRGDYDRGYRDALEDALAVRRYRRSDP